MSGATMVIHSLRATPGGGAGGFTPVPFVSPYGRRSPISVTSTSPGTSSTNASISINTINSVTAANGAGSSVNPVGFVDPAGINWYSGTPATTLWVYFNRTAVTLTPTVQGSSTQGASAGGVWENVSTGNRAVTVSVSATASVLETTASCEASATYQVYVQESATQPATFPSGTLLGNVRIESTASRTYTS